VDGNVPNAAESTPPTSADAPTASPVAPTVGSGPRPAGDMPPLPLILAEASRRSFWFFLLWAFGVRPYCQANPSDNWLWEPFHKPLCDWLEEHVKAWEIDRLAGVRRRRKLLVEVFRGAGKSTIGCALDLWIQLRNPDVSEVISSYDESKSQEFLSVNKVYMEGKAGHGYFKDWLGIWRPNLEEREWTRFAIVHMRRTNPAIRDRSMAIASHKTGLTGDRPDVFRYDDPIVRERINLDGQHVRAAKEHLDSVQFAAKSNALEIIYLTPYTEGDVAAKILREEGVASCASTPSPLRSTEYKKVKDGWHVYFCAVRDKNGRSVLPNIYPESRLEQMERDDPDDFASQMMCRPSEGSHMPLGQKDIDELWIDDYPSGAAVSIHMDTAFKEKKRLDRGDWNVIQVWAQRDGVTCYVWGWRDRRANAKEFVDKLVEILKRQKERNEWPFVITDEKSPGGKQTMFEDFLWQALRNAGLPAANLVAMSRGGTTKEGRIRQAVWAWKAKKVRLLRGAPEANELVYEMTHIGTSAFDDMADAAADAVHPEIFRPYLGPVEAAVVPERPYDQLLWTEPSEWTEDETRLVYDELEAEKDEGAEEDRWQALA